MVNINAGRRSPVDLESEISHLLKLRSIDNQTAALIRRVTNDCSAELPTTNRSGGTRTCEYGGNFEIILQLTCNYRHYNQYFPREFIYHYQWCQDYLNNLLSF